MLFDELFRSFKDDEFIEVIAVNGTGLYSSSRKFSFPLLIWEKLWKYEVQSVYTRDGHIVVEVIEE